MESRVSFYSDLDKIWGKEGRPPPETPKTKKRPSAVRGWLIAFGIIILLFIIIATGKGIYTEWLWFGSLGFSSVYTTILTTKLWLFFAGAAVFLALLLINLFLARRLSPASGGSISVGQGLILVRRAVDIGILLVSLFLSLIFGLVTSGQWEKVLRFTNGSNFGVTEPLLGRDVAFYIFNLPINNFAQGWLIWAAVIILIFTAVIYGLNLGFRRDAFTSPIKMHLAVLGVAIFFLSAWSYRLKIFDLLYSDRGVIFGAGYTDVTAQLLAWRSSLALR